jgi:hypothetical protein
MRNRYAKKNQYESEMSILVITIMSLCVSVCNNVNEVLRLFLLSDVLKSSFPFSVSLPRNLNVNWLVFRL